MNVIFRLYCFVLGCIVRRGLLSSHGMNPGGITEDYDEIDRRDPPIFINNTRTRVVVAAGKTATMECRVLNIGDRQVTLDLCQRLSL